jgi:hypothetical protein
MAIVFSRFSSLSAGHFRAVCFGQRVAALCRELEQSRTLVQWQCLSATVIMTTIVYILVRGLDSLWALALALPLLAIGGASLQHALTLFRFYVHAHAMPALCEAFGRLRYTVGEAPDLCFDRMAKAGLLRPHDKHLIDDVFYGEYRGHRLSLALVRLWSEGDSRWLEREGSLSNVVVMAVRLPVEPASLPADELSRIIEGQSRMRMLWSDGYLMMALPCAASPFDLGGLFEPPAQFACRLQQVAAVIQMPQNLIDYLLDEPAPETRPSFPLMEQTAPTGPSGADQTSPLLSVRPDPGAGL